jgi:hypothetical protein
MPKKNAHQLAWEKIQATAKKERLETQAKLKKVLTDEQYRVLIDTFKIVDRIHDNATEMNDLYMSDIRMLTSVWYGQGQYKKGVVEFIWRHDDA